MTITAVEKAELLDWLSEQTSLELSFQGWDEDSCWQVHRVTGGRNDREWTLLAEGETAAGALRIARRRSQTVIATDREHPAECDCENPEPASGVALVSEDCPIHGRSDA